MARRTPRPAPTQTLTLAPLTTTCPGCGKSTRVDYNNYRTLATLKGVCRLALRIRRCHNSDCPHFLLPFRPEAEGQLALPHHEFGLDVLALVGRLRHVQHRSTAEIHSDLGQRGLTLARRTVTNLLDRYDELRALDVLDPMRLRQALAKQRQVVLAIDGLQPDVGHEVLWVLRDCLSGTVLLARSLLSATQNDLATLLGEVRDAIAPLVITAVISDGQHSIRKAVAKARPKAKHQLCHFHYLREAARPLYEADRHAKKELKKRLRGIRKIEREVEGQSDEETQIVLGYCAAVRSALTDDGRPPLEASGLKLLARLRAIRDSLDRMAAQLTLPRRLERLRRLVVKGLEETKDLWPEVEQGYRWVWEVAHVLGNKAGHNSTKVRRLLAQVLKRMERSGKGETPLAAALRHFVKVSRSYWPGLFYCYRTEEIPRTNNDLEQLFGSHRHHDRRCSGRKQGSPGLVVRGAVRIVSGLLTRLEPEGALTVGPDGVAKWQRLRQELERRQERRRQQRRFRKDPVGYLKKLERRLNKPGLPV